MEKSTGTHFPAFAATIPNVMSATGRRAKARTYAPGMQEPPKTMNYGDFMRIVASGREVVTADKKSVMPALGDNVNVMCYVDDIFVYLKARADGALPRGKRPERAGEKPESATQNEKTCHGEK